MQMLMMRQDMSAPIDDKVEEIIKRKERIVFVTNGIIKQSNWEILSNNEKLKRLNKVQNQ